MHTTRRSVMASIDLRYNMNVMFVVMDLTPTSKHIRLSVVDRFLECRVRARVPFLQDVKHTGEVTI